MGGNGSYSKEIGGVDKKDRTHDDTEFRIEGHKVLVLLDNPSHDKIILNSNSPSPIYLIASSEKETGRLTISCIGIYENHKLVQSIDLKFDKKGNFIPFNKSEDGSHSHKWIEVSPGTIGRKKHDKNNYNPIPPKYQHLIDKIVEFNKKGKIWKKKKGK